MKAASTLIAWNGAPNAAADRAFERTERAAQRPFPAGSVGVGPLRSEKEADWSVGYQSTGGAAYVERRSMSPADQRFHVMLDWYMLVYTYGIHPYIVHRAFLLIDEYQSILKAFSMGPAEGEPGFDPNVGYGRAGDYPIPEITITQAGRATHFGPRIEKQQAA
jgi:hypothetical protein